MNESRRGFLAKVSGTLMAVTGARTVASLVAPGEADAYHFCGQSYTTDAWPPPPGLPHRRSFRYLQRFFIPLGWARPPPRHANGARRRSGARESV